MSDSRHNDQPAALKPSTDQQSRIMEMLLEKATFEVGRRQGSRLTGISKQGDNASHLIPPNTSNLASLSTPSFGVVIPPMKNNISATAYTKIPSIEASNLDEDKPMCRTESSGTSWSTGGISIDSGCFCSAGSKIESCTHAPSEDTFRGFPIPLKPEDFDFPEPIPWDGLPDIFQNHANLDLSQLFSYVTALEPDPESQPALPASTDPSDCGYSRETSEDSVETHWSSDQASSSSAVAERRKHQLMVQLMARLQEWLEVALKRHGVQNGQSTSNGNPTPVITASGGSGESSNNQNKRKHQRSDSDDEFGEDDETPDRTQKRGRKSSVDIETRYVCPFFKHNREKYKTSHWKSCCWPGWTSIHRVKCRQDLKSAFNLNEHQRADTICERQSEGAEEEGINEEQERLLRVRKRKNGKARQVTEEEKWVEMYKILFPDDDPVPSPYPELCPLQFEQPEQDIEQAGPNLLDSFEDYARREFSRRMRPRVENLVEGIFEQTLTSQTITDIATNVLQDIMESFRKGKRKPDPPGYSVWRRRRSPSRSPDPQEIPAVSSPQVPQEVHNFATEPYPNLEINIDEILNSLDANQSLELERWGIEDEGMNTFNHFGLQVEQYSKANA
ncbi:hypothetical protein FMUND_6798 [Fusarium mundagurra]|uniref:Uncharacterized protein n=1 Tax=Fusarium mundagurra TaxID=1567541 RepID=A0A8H5YND0_9HYPO|nr:hypothetical protein FMUND_6798 [Fusarium mundagurra]